MGREPAAMRRYRNTAIHMRYARGVACAVFLVAALWLPGFGPAGGRPALAQPGQKQLESDFSLFGRYLTDLFTQVGDKTRGEVFSFINKLQFFDVEGEIDRLVGNPWELSDSTSYKLSLASQHVAYPVYDRLLAQMTRLDEIRTRRIQNLTVDALPLIAVDLNATALPLMLGDALILSDQRSGSQIVNSILHYFDGREILDLAVFGLAQQPFFPQTEEQWQARKHSLAAHKGELALTVMGLGALFEAGALSNSGTIKRWRDDNYRLGWYGAFSRLGYHLQPDLRGGFTANLPGVELSAGLLEEIRPSTGSIQRAVEVALRESWLNRFTAANGWDSFAVLAAREVLATGENYQGEDFTGRIGLYFKRNRPFHLRFVTLRASFETESNLNDSLRFAAAVGVDYGKTGLSTVLQSSRMLATHDSGQVVETRTGLFLAGTMESPGRYYLDIMTAQGSALREAWEAWQAADKQRASALARMGILAQGSVAGSPVLEQLRRQTAEAESRRASLAVALADYLEARRHTYNLQRWPNGAGDLHGPIDGAILQSAASAIFTRLTELGAFLDQSTTPLSDLRERLLDVRLRYENLQTRSVRDEAAALQAELGDLDARWRQESEAVSEGLHQYAHYLACARRIVAEGGALAAALFSPPLSMRTQRKLLVLVAQPIF
jgi:hypothetical protein